MEAHRPAFCDNAGADKIFVNSAAVKQPELITKGAAIFGSQAIVGAIDVKWEPKSKFYQVYAEFLALVRRLRQNNPPSQSDRLCLASQSRYNRDH